MPRRPLCPTLCIAIAAAWLLAPPAHAQEEPVPSADDTAAGPTTPEPTPTPPPIQEHVLPDLLPEEQLDPLIMLGELRSAVRTSPERVDDRFKLAQTLYLIGDVDAALDECRAALAIAPQSAKGHVQLGVILMAKQDWRKAAAAMKDAVRLDPELAQAHYNLGTVHYSLGNPHAAVEAYRRALELQPDFPDARYRLALVLQLTNRHREAVPLMEEAAHGGVAQAQFFIGQAYRTGQGVGKDLERAIFWWTKATESGQQRAADALSQLRRHALAGDHTDRRHTAARDAFQRYREGLWAQYPGAVRTGPEEPLGTVLLRETAAANGLVVLLAEAYALSEPAHRELGRLYEIGLDSRLPAFDPRILKCLETVERDGFAPAKTTLARIYGKGLGVPRDTQKAKAFLKGLPKQDVKPILDELAAP